MNTMLVSFAILLSLPLLAKAENQNTKCTEPRKTSEIVRSCTDQTYKGISGIRGLNQTLEDVTFSEGIIIKSTFKNVTFRRIDFRGAKFKQVRFEDCTFEDIDFRGARFFNVQFVGGKFEQVKFDAAFFDQSSIQKPEFKTPSSFSMCVAVNAEPAASDVFKIPCNPSYWTR